jgi:hypothetical protein
VTPSGELLDLPISELLLDWDNPRLPPELRKRNTTQRRLALTIDRDYNSFPIADSIARHQFFKSEPLIALREGPKRYRVIEGNRRLTALMGLRNQTLLQAFARDNRAWRRLADRVGPDTVPVLVVTDRKSVAPLLGFRHISGIEPWEPYAQAAFIAGLVDDGTSLDDVSNLVGRSNTEVRSMYRDFDILRFAADNKMDVRPARDSFGVFNAAMGRPALRKYIGAEAPRNVDPDFEPISGRKKVQLANLLVLLFGNSKGEGRVIRDSRQIKDLVRVFSDRSGEAVKVLLETRDLEEALAALNSPEDQLVTALAAARRSVKRASNAWKGSLPATVTEQVDGLVEDVLELQKRAK